MDPLAGLDIRFFGIGGIRTASTWFATCLDEHPEIHVAEGKEPNAFVPALEVFERREEPRHLDWAHYRAAFRAAPSDAVLGDFSVQLLHNGPVSAPLVHQHYPQARLIVLLRDPVRRAYSHYWHHRHGHGATTSPPTFRSALEHPAFVRHSRYHEQLGAWLETFPPERFHFVLDEDIRADPVAVFAATFRFLGVDEGFVPGSLRLRLNRPTARRGLSDRVGRITGPLRRLGLGPVLDGAARLGLRRVQDRLDRRVVDVPPLDPDDARAMYRLVAEDIERMERLLGRSLGSWKVPYE